MSEVSGTKPIPSKCEEEAVPLVVEREYTIGRRVRKITLKTLVFLFIFSLGFIFSELRFTDQTDQVDNSHQFAYVYDTEQKIEDYYKMYERLYSEETELPPESPEVKEFMAAMCREQGRPLVAVGPFAIFVNNDGSEFSVFEIQSVKQEKGLRFPLVTLETSEQSKRLRFFSSSEKSGRLPRFYALFNYSEDGIYERGSFSVHKEDGSFDRTYFDRQGIGVFDRMMVSENGTLNTYHLKELSWEKVDNEMPQDIQDRIDKLDKASKAFTQGNSCPRPPDARGPENGVSEDQNRPN